MKTIMSLPELERDRAVARLTCESAAAIGGNPGSIRGGAGRGSCGNG